MDLRRLIPYKPPSWCAKISQHAPTHRLSLGNLNTPIHEWKNLPGITSSTKAKNGNPVRILIKRDDMTGSSLGGNKVRKLEFVLAEAVEHEHKAVITCGALSSNHARATAVATRQLGMQPHLVLRSRTPEVTSLPTEGNLLLDKMVGSKIDVVGRLPYLQGLKRAMEEVRDKEYDGQALLVPIGGSNVRGLWGYFECWREMMEGVDRRDMHTPDDAPTFEDVTDVVISVGTGGSTAGLAIANWLTGMKKRIHAVAICDDAKYFHGHVNETIEELGLQDEIRSEDILDVVEGHKGPGYSKQTDEGLQFIVDCAQNSGIFLDPTYTAKGALGMVKELNNNPERFAGDTILFVHTGGIFGIYDTEVEHIL
eukprot:Clim_evm2s64 gene=Clim_evmTU2s64